MEQVEYLPVMSPLDGKTKNSVNFAERVSESSNILAIEIVYLKP